MARGGEVGRSGGLLQEEGPDRQQLLRVRQAHFLVGLQSGLPLDIVLEGLTGDLVVESGLRMWR